MKVLGIIPARGGSRRLPKKNILDLGGKPLIQWTIDAAKDSQIFDQIVVSTEDDDIGRLVEAWNPSDHGIWWKRPKSLARDDTPSWPVVLDVFEQAPADVVVLLQPTSPLRSAADIRGSIELLKSTKGDAVFSVTKADDDLNFELGFANRLRPLSGIVVPNGAIYAITKQSLEQGNDWYDGVVYGYPMSKDCSLDIDTALDLEFARIAIQRAA